VKRLGECAKFRTGPFGSALHKSDYTDDGVPVINPMHIFNGTIAPSRTMTITEKAARSLSDFRLKRGDIVIGRRGDMGRCAVIQDHQAGWLCGTGSMIIRCEKDTNADFLQRVLSSPQAIAALEDTSVGTTMVNLNQGTLAGLRIQFPPLAEQRAIAEALSDADGLLGGLDRLIAKKRDLKQAAMQQLLTGQTRLPGFHGEWVEVPASVIGVFRGGTGFPLHAQGETTGAYPFFKVSDMNNEGNDIFMTNANHWISEQTRKRLGAFTFPANSIVFAKVGVAIFLERKKILRQPSCIDNNMAAFVLDGSRANVRFVHTLLLSKKLGDLVATTALPALNGKQLGEMKLSLPPLPEQTAIAEVLSDMDAELAALEQRREKTRALKQAMMQELLTGKTRLVNG
jgi:type I restriction enzyme S subunit